MAHILEQIVMTKREEVAALRARASLGDLKARAAAMPPTRGFAAALAASGPHPPAPSPRIGRGGDRGGNGTSSNSGTPIIGGGGGCPKLIAEVKKASPSKGIIRFDFDPVAAAQAYHAAGASCLSVLTDETYFQGNLTYLRLIREVVPLPLLRKDFIIDPAQIYEARIAGADAVLLIVAILLPAQVAEYRDTAVSLGLDALVEVHDREELETAKAAGATLIGVNNRDLKTFDVRLETTEELLPHMPPGSLAVAESGIHTRQDAERLAGVGAHAILVGESLMRADDMEAATRKLLGR